MKHLLIEGWRGVNHSFALVNQCQILELHRLGDLRLFHRDLPFAMAHWNTKSNGAGFSAGGAAVIEGLREPAFGERGGAGVVSRPLFYARGDLSNVFRGSSAQETV